MTTLVGTQTDFYKAIAEMLQLENDAIDAYETAIERLENAEYKARFQDFLADHNRHKTLLTSILSEAGNDLPRDFDLKHILTKGKVIIAGLINDKAILIAMGTNEDDTNKAYERLTNHENAPDDLKQALIHALDDERRHRAWIRDTLDSM
ncbi:MAG: DUF2383 domain-containing protein [Alphaproteobacteria bacterium]